MGWLPFVFSQSEDINGRSFIPMQDTPSVKAPYSASISVDSAYQVVMSATNTGSYYNNSTNITQWTFNQQIAIPSYLIAFAIGDISYQFMGGRCGIYAQPSQLQGAIYEFANINTLLDTVESYLQVPYAWGVYNMLIMPYSFPLGGMENPMMNFISPTVITGTRSQVYVVIHEMSHSWTGNMVTMNNWEDFWLNEGFTVFIERQSSARLYGSDFAMVEANLGNVTIVNTL